MDLNIHVPTGTLLADSNSRTELGELRLSQRNSFPIAIRFFFDEEQSIVAGPIPTPFTRIAISGQKNDSGTSAILFFLDEFTAAGTGAQILYTGNLITRTDETNALFETISRNQQPIEVDIDLLVGIDSDQGRRTIIQRRPAFLKRTIWSGSDSLPSPAITTSPVVQYLDDRPENKTDFFMFPGGIAPSSGLYQAADANYTYTFKGGWTQWRRSPISSW